MRRFVLCAGAGRGIGWGTSSRADSFEGDEGMDDSTDGRWEAGSAGNMELTPFERAKESLGKEYFTQAEAAEFAKRAREHADRDRRGATPQEDVGGAYNEACSTVETRRPREWSSFDFGTGHPNCAHSTTGFRYK
jgi:hypothetical protein